MGGVPRWRRAAEEASDTYSDSYVFASGVQAMLLSSVSDAVSQSMHGLSIDAAHCAAMATIAFTLSGALNALWLRFLEERVPGSSMPAIATKTACDYCFCATQFNSAYIALVPVLTALYSGTPPDEAFQSWGWTAAGFKTTMILEASTFSPYNLFAFRVVPPQLRPVSSATLSAACTIVISGLTLGYEN